MTLLGSLLTRIALIIAALVVLTAILVVERERFVGLRGEFRGRLATALPYFLLLGAVLVVNNVLRDVVPEVSWFLRLDLTHLIHDTEGNLVVWLQSFATPELTAFFSFVYVYGYVFLLVFPVVAYLALDDQRPLCETCLAYSFNYALGLVLYAVFIAYGPRNLDLVEGLMYTSWPESQLLTSQINTNTNVFPSLHSSLSATVALLAYRTRDQYPTWLYISSGLAVAIILSTMYLGIHWGIDVLAGIALAVVSVVAAGRFDVVASIQERTDGAIGRRAGALWQRLRDGS